MPVDSIFSYVNKFMYFIVRPDDTEPGAFLYCSGVSMPQFLPITRGRHGLASNPAMRGLQLADLNLRKELIDLGARTSEVKGNPCGPFAPGQGDWYRQLLRVTGADIEAIKKLAAKCPLRLVGSIFQACMITDIVLPAVSPSAEEFESLLTEVCKTYSKQAGWPTTASAKGFRK
ncbi:MAG TPA: hypothetical protein VK448_05825 [Dissulfurispiraceae bacterium]|nr:hypothetical protein [Dissulfurispiraceae bacterium]